MTMFKDVKRLGQYWDLLVTLTFRDIQVRYKQTFLGVAWAVTQPLAFMVILTTVKTLIFKESNPEGVPNPIFIYCAMVPWIFFQNSLGLSTNSVSGNLNLVKKIYFPREILPMASIFASVIDFLIASGIFFGMMLFYHIPFTASLLWIPVLFLIELVFVLGVGLFVAASNVFYRDVKYIVPLIVQLLFFASPIFYSVNQVPEGLRRWYLLNPIAVVIDGFRRAIIHGTAPEVGPLVTTFGMSVFCCVLAYAYFKHVEVKFADLI